MYTIIAFYPEDGTLEFEHTALKNKIAFKLSEDQEKKYRKVQDMHYLDLETKEIIIINDPVQIKRLMLIDTDGKMYKRATQADFDEWMNIKYPDSDNAKVYNLFNEKSVDPFYDSESDDEDPYYRGTMDEFLKQVEKNKGQNI